MENLNLDFSNLSGILEQLKSFFNVLITIIQQITALLGIDLPFALPSIAAGE